jgi:hypothetical protein
MINSRTFAKAVTVILVITSAGSLSACASPGVTRQAQHYEDVINYCVKRGTQMECRKVRTAAYAEELEMENMRLEMRETNFD